MGTLIAGAQVKVEMITLFVDARCFQDPNYAYRGIGRHASHLVKTLRDAGGADIDLVAVTAPSLPEMSPGHQALFGRAITKPPVWFSEGDCFLQPSPMTHDPAFIERFLAKDDLFKVAVIHDFIPYDAAGYLTDKQACERYERQLANLSRVDAFFPNSHYSGRRLVEICGVDAQKVHVTGIAVGEAFYAGGSAGIGLAPQGYYFFVGGEDKRKNAPLAIAATAECNRAIGRDFPLVICGGYEPATIAELVRLRPGHKLVFLSNISDADLAALYRDSLLTVAPSFIEGFSIPVVEAIAAGAPVFASDCDAHRELIGTEEALFPPDNAMLAAKKMVEFLFRPGAREELLRKQSAGAGRYRGAAVGHVFWNGFSTAFRRHRDQRASIAKPAVHDGDRRPRLAFMTPWPPEKSGVAEHSMVTCRALSKLCRLDVFTRGGSSQRIGLHEGRILDLDSPELDARNYDHIFHVIGNSTFHKPMLDRLVAKGGAAVIHDSRLLEYYYSHLSTEDMAALTERFVGRPVSRPEIDSWVHHPPAMATAYLDDVLHSADPIIVHTRGLAEEILKKHNVSARYVPLAINKDLDVDIFTDAQKIQGRQQIGIAPDRFLVVALGHVLRDRGNTECVFALKRLIDWGYPVDFWFAGPSHPLERARLRELADQLGLADNLFFTDGHISDEKYRHFLFAADFAVQLRKTGLGQGSGTVQDCALVGLTCVANQDLADSVDAPSYVLRIPNVISSVLIAEKIANGIDSGAHKMRHDDERETYRREHGAEAYAENFLKAVLS